VNRLSAKRLAKRMLIFLLPPLLLALAIINVIDSPALLPWISVQLQKHMAGVSINNISGTLQDRIHIDKLRIASGRAVVTLDDVQAKLRWRCLLWATLCVEDLHTTQLLIDVRASDEPSTGAPLPVLQTPVALDWKQLRVDRLVFGSRAHASQNNASQNNAPHIDAIRSNGSWAGSKLSIYSGQLQYLQTDVELDGNIIFRNGYPVDLRARVSNAATGVYLSANIGGEVAQLNAQLQIERPARAQGGVAFSPLDPQLPYRGKLSLITPYLWRPADTSTAITVAEGASIELKGNKEAIDGELQSQASVDGLNQTVQMNSPFQFDIAKLLLTLSPHVEMGKTQLDGKAMLTLGSNMSLSASADVYHVDPGIWIKGYDGDVDASAVATLDWRDGQLTQARGEINSGGKVQQDNVTLRANGDWDRKLGWKLAQADVSLGDATLRVGAKGRGSAANLQLSAAKPQVGVLDLQCDVDGIAEPTLRATCAKLTWAAPSEWQLPSLQNQSALRFSYVSVKKLATLAPFCLRAGAASVCSEKESRWSNGDIAAALKINAIDLAWSRFWLPKEYALQGNLAGDINVRGGNDKLPARWSIKLATQDAQITLPTGAHKTTLLLKQFDANVDSDNTRLVAVVTAAADRFGDLDAHLTMTPDQQLKGYIALKNSTLAALQPLLPQAEIKGGTLQADVSIAGSRSAPSLRGALQLQQGEVRTAQLPWPVKNIEAKLSFEDRQAQLQAAATIDDHPIETHGNFDWQQSLTGTMRFVTKELRITPLPRTDLWISPDLTAKLQDGVVDIQGHIDVPRAYIIVKELPKSGIAISRDVVIVSDMQDKKSSLKVTGNIDVILGDAVSFRGFGLQTRLAGRLGLGFQDGAPTGNGRVQLIDGSYRAYGQLLDIRSGDLIFVGALDNPVIRIEAIRSDVAEPNVIGVRVNGELRNPDIALFSTPAMSEQAQLQYLLTGRAPDSDTETKSSGSMLGQALLALSAGESEGVVAGVADKFGVHDVSLSTAEGTTGTQVQLSAYLNSRLFLRYGKSVFDNANEITMRYQLTKSLFVEAVSGIANALDLLWTLEFGRAED